MAFCKFLSSAVCALTGMLFIPLTTNGQSLPNLFPFPNASGFLETYNTTGGPISLTGPFFQPLGANGRSCVSCHRPAQGWSLSSDEVRLRFELTHGKDPLFRTVDGSNCGETAETSTLAGRRRAYSLLLDRALIRVAIQFPDTAEFNVISVSNPYGCNDPSTLSVYRRPLPTTNLRFLSTLMWDGRESSTQTGTQKITFATNPADLLSDLAHQSASAVNIHAQGVTPLTEQQQQEIVDFQMQLVTAQAFDYRAGPLDGKGAFGGPVAIAQRFLPDFFLGINDPLGGNPQNIPFTPTVFRLFEAWSNTSSNWEHTQNQQRARIARGQDVFNSKPINITGVAGLNDDLNLAAIPGTCGTCHDSPNIGNHSVAAPLNIGVSDVNGILDVSYLPVFTLQNKSTFEVKMTTDPGRALITGVWKDIGRLKGPILRGLASRAPYFHNGSARTLEEVLTFYDKRFQIGLTDEEKQDLIAFLNSL